MLLQLFDFLSIFHTNCESQTYAFLFSWPSENFRRKKYQFTIFSWNFFSLILLDTIDYIDTIKFNKYFSTSNYKKRSYSMRNESKREYYMGWKVPGFLMKISVFWAKLYLFLNIVAFEGDTLGIAIFQHFDALSVVRSFRNTPRYPRWLPHSMWISFPGATAWGLGTDNSRRGPSLENTVSNQFES